MKNSITLVVESFENSSEFVSKVKKKGGRVFLTHYFDIGGNYFPDKNWTDLSAAILDMWLENLTDVKNNNIFHFMDGSYVIHLYGLNDVEYLIRFGNYHHDDFVESSIFEPVVIDKNLFKQTIVNASNFVLDLLKVSHIDPEDYYFKRLKEKLDR